MTRHSPSRPGIALVREAALAGEDSAELATRDERWQALRRGLEHVAVGRDELSHGRATGRVTIEDGAVMLDVAGRLDRLSAKALVDGRQECRCDPVVDQESGRGEHDGHPERKRQHQAQPDRQARDHAVSVRSRYPTPRTVSIASAPICSRSDRT